MLAEHDLELALDLLGKAVPQYREGAINAFELGERLLSCFAHTNYITGLERQARDYEAPQIEVNERCRNTGCHLNNG